MTTQEILANIPIFTLEKLIDGEWKFVISRKGRSKRDAYEAMLLFGELCLSYEQAKESPIYRMRKEK